MICPSPLQARAGFACLLALSLSACSLPVREAAPQVALASGWKSMAPAGWVSTQDYRHWQAGQWWALFGDPTLDALMGRVESDNQSLALAVANVAQAEALLRQAEAQLWPTLGGQAGAQRSGRPAGGSATLGLTASWAPDLWGRLGALAQAQQAGVEASRADLAGARLAAQGSLAQAYFGLREADAELLLFDEIITGYERAATITGNRYRAGVAASTLANAQSTRSSLRRSRATLEHAMALLVGAPPAAFSLAPAPWVAKVPAIPPALPSELLLRRPDVASAERDVVAANLRIGAARAAWFPSVSLTGGLGARGASLGQLVSAPALTWSLGAALVQAIFDAGARDAATAQSIAAHQAATARYRQSALAAMGQVEDQLTALDTLAAQIEQVRAAADAAAGAEQRIMNSYQAGLAAYTSVVTAQASTLGARRSLMQLQLQRQQAAVALIQALGGGWQADWPLGQETSR